jgi:hypothetical protein
VDPCCVVQHEARAVSQRPATTSYWRRWLAEHEQLAVHEHVRDPSLAHPLARDDAARDVVAKEVVGENQGVLIHGDAKDEVVAIDAGG